MYKIIKIKDYNELAHYVNSYYGHIDLSMYNEITDFVVMYKTKEIKFLYSFAYKTDKITVISLPKLNDITSLMSKKTLYEIDTELRQLFLF